MLKKGLVIGVIVLFIGMSIPSSSGNIMPSEDTTPPVTDITHDPPDPDGHKGWFISDITISFEATDDLSGVDATYYRINEGEWKKYVEPFKLENDGFYQIEFYSVDNAGNVEDVKSREFKIDQTPPEIGFYYSYFWKQFQWYIKFIAIADDAMSGMDKVEFYAGDNLAGLDKEEPYEWIFIYSEIFGYLDLKVVAYDLAGNSDYDDYPEYKSVTIVSQVSASQQISQQFLIQSNEFLQKTGMIK
jgi:hypothetical protein